MTTDSRPGFVPEIKNISDTARWVAYYRALESARPDALFNDHLAARIAGERGAAMAASMPRGPQFAWALAVRTRLIDEVITARIKTGQIGFVVNLAAGFDTRPYRLDLPASLRWIEADLGPLVAEKNELLKDEKPRVRLERVAVDLADESARAAFLRSLPVDAGPGLVLTEGLLIYLDRSQVQSLGRALAETPQLTVWASDLVSPLLLEMMRKSSGPVLAAAGAPVKFAEADPERFFGALGWTLTSFHSMWLEADRLKRTMRFSWFWKFISLFMSEARRREGARMSGIIELDRQAR